MTHFEALSLEQNLSKRAVSGGVVTGLSQAAKFLTQILSVILLSRLLRPEDFGVFAMSTPVVALAALMQDLGLSQAMIASTSLRAGLASSVFYLNLAASVVVAVALITLAGPLAAFYNQPAVTAVLQMSAFGVALAGISSIHLALLTRNMRYGYLAIVEAISSVVGLAGALLHAYLSPSPMALATMVVCTGISTAILSWSFTKWLPGKPAFTAETVRLLGFGSGLTGFNLTNYLARSSDNIIIGKVLGAFQLGIYDRAYRLMLAPLQQINNPLSKVLIPVLSRLRTDPTRYSSAYRRAVSLVNLTTVPGIIFLGLSAEQTIPFLLGSEWQPSAKIFSILAIAGVHQPFTATLGWLFISQERGNDFAKWGLFNAVTCLFAFIIGVRWGIVGVASAYAITDVLIRMPVVWWWATRTGPIEFITLLTFYRPIFLGGLFCILTMSICLAALHGSLLLMIVGPTLCYVSYMISLTITQHGRSTLQDVWRLLKLAKLSD